jgi:hypothetical protein
VVSVRVHVTAARNLCCYLKRRLVTQRRSGGLKKNRSLQRFKPRLSNQLAGTVTELCWFTYSYILFSMRKLHHVGPLWSRHGASSDCEWKRGHPDMEGSCEYIEWAVADSRHVVVLQRMRGNTSTTVKMTLLKVNSASVAGSCEHGENIRVP